jgi:hypothetical protein
MVKFQGSREDHVSILVDIHELLKHVVRYKEKIREKYISRDTLFSKK